MCVSTDGLYPVFLNRHVHTCRLKIKYLNDVPVFEKQKTLLAVDIATTLEETPWVQLADYVCAGKRNTLRCRSEKRHDI
ncbi:hypothetical protein J6590_051798 [Homalodisca vitripennis]|nr:hypothetical protein J6590_051798 [Homalodisca vitripennis]